MSKDRKAVDEWETREGGGVRAVGVGAGITGFGGGLIMIDDPVKNRAEAESRVRRDNAWDWFSDDIYTRLEPKASVILIQTRWHEDDLAGRLIKRMAEGGDQWEIVNLPALAEVQSSSFSLSPPNREEQAEACTLSDDPLRRGSRRRRRPRAAPRRMDADLRPKRGGLGGLAHQGCPR